MGRHLRQSRRRPALTATKLWGPLLVIGAAAVGAGVALTARGGDAANVAESCPTAVHVVTAQGATLCDLQAVALQPAVGKIVEEQKAKLHGRAIRLGKDGVKCRLLMS